MHSVAIGAFKEIAAVLSLAVIGPEGENLLHEAGAAQAAFVFKIISFGFNGVDKLLHLAFGDELIFHICLSLGA